LASPAAAQPEGPIPVPEAPEPDDAPMGDDPSPDRSADAPWAIGVAADDKSQAVALFEEGNRFFERSQYAQALQRYRSAIEHWDHPAIRGNIAVSLINLDQAVEAYENIELALKYGDAPFDQSIYNQLVTNRKLLLGQLGQLEVECEQSDAEVTLDGQFLFRGPGTASRILLAGSHQIVASKPGYLTVSEAMVLLPGKPTTVNIELVPLTDTRVFKRRWARWKPWAVIGGGTALALIGVPLQIAAANNIEQYEREVGMMCRQGCSEDELSESVQDLESRAKIQNGVAISAFALGGAALVTGVILVAMNQPRLVAGESPQQNMRVSISPTGMAVALDF
jgi:tetratricopeptide (TPR) repeat protein